MNECLPACTLGHSLHAWCFQGKKRVYGNLKLELHKVVSWPCGYWEPNSSVRQVQKEHFIAEPSLQPFIPYSTKQI